MVPPSIDSLPEVIVLLRDQLKAYITLGVNMNVEKQETVRTSPPNNGPRRGTRRQPPEEDNVRLGTPGWVPLRAGVQIHP